ncbi:MAG: hypothetical protein Q4D20_01930 [Clostridia bacterium]|nr:hypothetical protein [Clostridia bacterium]
MNVADVICLALILLALIGAIVAILKGKRGCCGKHGGGCDCCCENCSRSCDKRR